MQYLINWSIKLLTNNPNPVKVVFFERLIAIELTKELLQGIR
jgi:hypothetical protein